MQDAYSLRCAPQVHRASRDLLRYVEATVEVELNAATDNPLVLVHEGEIVSNGNFHGQPVAFGLDALAIAVAELADISERRLERMVNPSLSDGLPPFLTEGGPQLRFHDPAVRGSVARLREQGALPSCERGLHPDERRPGGSCLDGQRGGPEGAPGARQRGARGRDRAAGGRSGDRFLAPLQPGRGVAPRGGFVRTLSERLRDDRPLSADIERVATAVRDGSFVAAVESEVGELA